ncbi:aminopeptidase [Chloroflexota bacterium]
MTITRWGEFGEAAVRMMGQVKPDENLLIVADTWTNMEIAEACLIAGINAKANAQLLIIPKTSLVETREYNASTAGAIQGADVVVALCGGMFPRNLATRKACEGGTRVASTRTTGIEDFLIEGILDVDYDLMVRICEKICALFESTEICRVTSPLGTDLSFRLKGRTAPVGDGIASVPGELDFFPGVDASIAPIEESVHGTMIVDGSVVPDGLVRSPITCHLEEGVITAIESGPSADAWRTNLESTGEPRAFHLAHFTLGLNPRARLCGNMMQDERVMGAVTFGFGHQDPIYGGLAGPAKVHIDAVLASPSVYLDGLLLCENNQLNPDLGLGGL